MKKPIGSGDHIEVVPQPCGEPPLCLGVKFLLIVNRVCLCMSVWFHMVVHMCCDISVSWTYDVKMPPCVCTYSITNGYLFIKLKGRWIYKLGRGGVTRLTLLATGATEVKYDDRKVRVPVACENILWRWCCEV